MMHLAKTWRRSLRLALVLLTAALGPRLAWGQGEAGPTDENALKKVWPSEGREGELFRDTAGALRCPTCTGLSVLESDARFSQQIKQIVLEQLQAGKSKDEVLAYFTQRYGAWILRAPPKHGANIVAWALPLGLLVCGPPLVWFFVWRRRRVLTTHGIRSASQILKEFDERLERLRSA